MGVPTAILKDPRKISDKNFQAKCVAKLVEVDRTHFLSIYIFLFLEKGNWFFFVLYFFFYESLAIFVLFCIFLLKNHWHL